MRKKRTGEEKEDPHYYEILGSVYCVEISVWIVYLSKTLEAHDSVMYYLPEELLKKCS